MMEEELKDCDAQLESVILNSQVYIEIIEFFFNDTTHSA